MTSKEYKTIFKLRRADADAWPADYILKEGEPGFELDTGKLKIGDGIQTWGQLKYINNTNSSNTAFEIGENLKFNNGILDANYGDLETKKGIGFLLNPYDLPNEIKMDQISIPEVNQLMTILEDTTKGKLINFITSGLVEFIVEYEDETIKKINTQTKINLEEENNFNSYVTDISEILSVDYPIYFAGSENALNFFISLIEDNSSDELIENWQQEKIINKFTYIAFDDPDLGYLTIGFFPATLETSDSGAKIKKISIEGNISTPHKIPSAALKVGQGLSIDTNDNIQFDYGQKIDNYQRIYWKIDTITQQSDQNLLFKNFYGWAYDGNRTLTSIDLESLSLNNLSNQNFYKFHWKTINKKEISPNNISTSSSLTSINYETDDYYYTNIYYGDNENFEKIQCNQLPYGTVLYDLFDNILEKESYFENEVLKYRPTIYNTFFWGSYNCNEDFSQAFNNTLTPKDPSKHYFGIIILLQSNKIYFIVISPESQLPIGLYNNTFLFDYEEILNYKILPREIINSYSCQIKDENNISFGIGNIANAKASSAFGINTIANGDGSAAFGYNSIAYNNTSFTLGHSTIASADCSIACGSNTIAKGASSIALGSNNQSNGFCSIAGGQNTIANGINSLTFGQNIIAQNENQIVLGAYNNPNDSIFQIGGGISDNQRLNTFEIDSSGRAYRSIFNSNNIVSKFQYWDTSLKLNSRNKLEYSASLENVIETYNTLIEDLQNAQLMKTIEE